MPDALSPAVDERLPTGIPGLDVVLSGGLWRGSLYLIEGLPGTGKTILANQMCAHVARGGGRAIYVSMLAESFTIMLAHLRRMSFFDTDDVGEAIRYVSASSTIDEAGFAGMLALIRTEAQRARPDLVVIDTLVPVHETMPSELQLKRRLLELQALATLGRFVTVFLTNDVHESRAAVLEQMADGILELAEESFDVRSQRSIQVRKLRGSSHLAGRHVFRIGRHGLQVFPRLESIPQPEAPDATRNGQLTSGCKELDAMLCGGYASGTVTGLIGGPGSGKTTLGLQFVAQATPEEPALVFGFFERPGALRRSAQAIGIDLGALERTGALKLVWNAHGEHLMDELAHLVLEETGAIRAKRLLIDGLEAFVEAAVHPQRITAFMTALSLELRRVEATTLITTEREPITGLELTRPIHGSSPVFDNLVVVRMVEQQARLVRLLSIAKLRGSAFDHAIREFEITARGIRVGPRWNAAGYSTERAEAHPARA